MPTKVPTPPPAAVPPLTLCSPVSPGQMTSVGLISTKLRTSHQYIAVVTPATRGKGPQAPPRHVPQAYLTWTEERRAVQPQRPNSLPNFVLNQLVIPWKCIETNLLRNVTLNKADPALSCHQEPQNPVMQRKTRIVHQQMLQALTLHNIRQTE